MPDGISSANALSLSLFPAAGTNRISGALANHPRNVGKDWVATVADRESVDLYRFTSQLLRSLDEDGRRRIVKMMWQMVYADGNLNEFEDNIVWRASDLLGISTRDRVELRREAVAESGKVVDDA